MRFRRLLPALLAACATGALPLAGQSPLETTVPPGANFDKAEFRLWLPPGLARVEAVVVLVPGSNGDGRPMVDDTAWQGLAARRHLALLGTRFTDRPHEQGFIEEYVAVGRGSGQALLTALRTLAASSGHPELAGAPLLFWGMSAGGQFSYEFAAWTPERVAAFVVNKGGIYYTALTPRATREIPAVLFTGGKDLAFRTKTIEGLFAVNRRGGALWALANEPGAAHVVGGSRDYGILFFDQVLPLRLAGSVAAADGTRTLAKMPDRDGFIGDLAAGTYAPATATSPPVPTAWLPTEAVAKAWRAMVTGPGGTP